jgi:hypothetical protein
MSNEETGARNTQEGVESEGQSQEQVEVVTLSDLGQEGLPEEKPHKIAEKQEDTRGRIAVGLTFILGFILFSTLAVAAFTGRWEESIEFLKFVLPAVVGLLGSALGFYFGTRPSSDERPRGDP